MILLGILMLLLMVANMSPASGRKGNVFYLEVRRTGEILFGEAVLSDQTGIRPDSYADLKNELKQVDQPLILLQYPKPETSDIDPKSVQDFERTLTEDGFQVRLVEKGE